MRPLAVDGCPHVCVSPFRCHVCGARLVEANRANGLSTQQHEKSRSHKKPQHWQGLGAKRPVTLRERCGTALPRQRLSTPTHWWGFVTPHELTKPPSSNQLNPPKPVDQRVAAAGGVACVGTPRMRAALFVLTRPFWGRRSHASLPAVKVQSQRGGGVDDSDVGCGAR